MKLIKIKSMLIAFSFIISFNSHSQIYKAGDTLSKYVDINPDTLLTYTCSPANSNESYYFDVNGDSQNDFQIEAHCNTEMAGTEDIEYITVISLNPNSYIRFGRIDTSWYGVIKVAKPLQYGDTINTTISKWDSATLYLINSSEWEGNYVGVSDFVNTNDTYIGIKYQNAIDTIYGWIRVNCPNVSECYIKDYSIGTFNVSIQAFEFGNINIYPNPASDKIHIAHTNNDAVEVCLYDMVGRQVSAAIKSNKQTTAIDVSGLSEGIYFLQLKMAKGIVTKKIIVQR